MQKVWDNDGDQVLAYMRGEYVFVFNFSPAQSFTDYGLLTPPGTYRTVLNTDDPRFGGNGLTDDAIEHLTQYDPLYEKEYKGWLKLYLPARTAMVLKRLPEVRSLSVEQGEMEKRRVRKKRCHAKGKNNVM